MRNSNRKWAQALLLLRQFSIYNALVWLALYFGICISLFIIIITITIIIIINCSSRSSSCSNSNNIFTLATNAWIVFNGNARVYLAMHTFFLQIQIPPTAVHLNASSSTTTFAFDRHNICPILFNINLSATLFHFPIVRRRTFLLTYSISGSCNASHEPPATFTRSIWRLNPVDLDKKSIWQTEVVFWYPNKNIFKNNNHLKNDVNYFRSEQDKRNISRKWNAGLLVIKCVSVLWREQLLKKRKKAVFVPNTG